MCEKRPQTAAVDHTAFFGSGFKKAISQLWHFFRPMNPPQTPVAPKPSRTTHGLTGLIGLIIAEGELKGCLKETAKPSKAILHNTTLF